MNYQQMTLYHRHKGYFDLRREILWGNTEEARNLIQNGVDVNIPDVKDNTPLHWAITQLEDLEIMMMLLDKGADIHAINDYDYKPLEVAIQNEKKEAALLLIEKGALVGEDLNLYLLTAIKKDSPRMVKMLIDHGMQHDTCINLRTLNAAICQGHPEIIEHIIPHCGFSKPSDQYIPKELVIESGEQYKKCIELLLKWNFTINPNSHLDEDFIYGVVKNGNLSIFLELFKMGIDVTMVNSKTKLNLLTMACLYKRHDIVEYLLQHNADVNVTMPINTEMKNNLLRGHHSCGVNVMTPTDIRILENKRYIIHHYNQLISSKYNTKDSWGITCLHIAVLNSDPMMVKLLLTHGAMITDDPTFFNLTCIAVQVNYEEIFRIFLERGVNVNEIDAQGKSLLHFCVSTGGIQDFTYNIANLLLENGAAVQIQSPGNTFLFDAMRNGHRQTARLFLDYNADIQYITPDGDTLLHKAIEKGFDVEFIQTLLKRHSPVDAINNNKLTPLLVAFKTQLSNQNLDLVTVLLKNQANPNVENAIGQTPLHIICKHKSKMAASIAQILLEHGANIEATDANGRTPLFNACEAANHSTVKCLMDHSANVNHTDSEGLTPLYIATQNCQYNSVVFKILLEHNVNFHCMLKLGKSIIFFAVENNNSELIKNLALTSINFNSVNEDGNTPLHIAVQRGLVDIAKTLIKYGADINALNEKNKTPYQNAAKIISIIFRNRGDSWDTSIKKIKLIPIMGMSPTDARETFLKTLKILRAQVIKLKIAGLKVNAENLELTSFPDKFRMECERETEMMKMESIGVNNLTFYDLLKKNIHVLSRLVEYKQIQQTLELEIYDEKFPIYIDIVRSRFREAKIRYRFMNAAKKYFTANICPQLIDDCIDIVLSYLTIEEIEIFVDTMKSLV